MADNFTPTPVKGRKAHNATAITDDNVGALVAVSTNLAPTLTEGTQVALSTDLGGRLRVVLSDATEGGSLDVDVVDRQARILGMVRTDLDTRAAEDTRIAGLRDALLAGLESVSLNADTRDDLVTRLSTNLESVDLNVATRDDIVTRLTTAIVDMRDTLRTNLESVDLNAPTLDRLTTANPYVRGAAVSDTNPLPIVVQTNPGIVRDTGLRRVDNVAAGATANLDSAAVAANTSGRLLEVTVSASVRTRVELQVSTNGTAPVVTPIRVFFVEANESFVYRPVDQDAVTAVAGGFFRLAVTNMDNLSAANVYGSITHNEV